MRIDEGGCKHETGCVHDAVLVRVDSLRDLGDHAVVDPHVEHCIDPFGRIEHSRAAKDDVRLLLFADPEHHATSAAARARTPTGPPVSTS